MTTLTLQGASDWVDTYVYSGGADTAYGSQAYLNVSSYLGIKQIALFKPNLSGLPVGATINSATLYLTLYNSFTGGTILFSIRRILAANNGWDGGKHLEL